MNRRNVPFKIFFIAPILLGIGLLLITGNSLPPLIGMLFSTVVWLVGISLETFTDFREEFENRRLPAGLIALPWYLGFILIGLAMATVLIDNIFNLNLATHFGGRILHLSFLLMWLSLSCSFLVGFAKFVWMKRVAGKNAAFVISSILLFLTSLPIFYVDYLLISGLVDAQ